MADTKNATIDSALLLAGCTAFLYAAGTAHFHGYLETLRLDTEVLDRNFHQTLYTGFLVSVLPVSVGLILYATARMAFSHVVLPSHVDWLRQGRRSKRKFLSLRRQFMGKRRASKEEQRQKRASLHVLRFVAVPLVLLLSLAHFEQGGKRAAVGILQRISDGRIDPTEVSAVKLQDQTVKLLVLTCGARNCAGVDPVTGTVYYFPQNGHSFQHPHAVTKNRPLVP